MLAGAEINRARLAVAWAQVFGPNPWLWFIPVGTMSPGLDGVKWETSEFVKAGGAGGA